MSDLYSLTPSQVVLYGVSWCGDCRRARQVFAEEGQSYIDIDIEQDDAAANFVKKINHGNQSVPTIIFPDGAILIEPDRSSLTQKLKNDAKTA